MNQSSKPIRLPVTAPDIAAVTRAPEGRNQPGPPRSHPAELRGQ